MKWKLMNEPFNVGLELLQGRKVELEMIDVLPILKRESLQMNTDSKLTTITVINTVYAFKNELDFM